MGGAELRQGLAAGPRRLRRLKPDTASGWGSGKKIHYPGGSGTPDDEGITLTGAGSAGGVYTSNERDNDHGGTSRLSVLRYDVGGAATTLSARRSGT